MPRPAPLPSAERAKRSLAHRLTRTADRLRQLYTRFGLRSARVFLVWTKWSGPLRGEGNEAVIVRREILPTPRVSDRTAIACRSYFEGVLPDGQVRVDQISAGALTADNLRGLVVPDEFASAPRGSPTHGALVAGTRIDPASDPRIDFYFEIVEDGRGDEPPVRDRFRLVGGPWRSEGALSFAINLERTSDDFDRVGQSRVGDDDVFTEG